MCTDKWRNLLKEFKKAARHHHRNNNNNNVGKVMTWHKEIEEILRDRGSNKGDSFMGFSHKGIDEPSISFGPVEDNVVTNGASPWNWRETPGSGEACNSYGGRVITVKWGDYRKRIGIDGTSDSIKETIKSAFRLRTKRAFWLEDEENIVRALDRDMPLGSFTLHLDEGLTIKVCVYEEPDHIPVHTEDKTFYNEDDFHDANSRSAPFFKKQCTFI